MNLQITIPRPMSTPSVSSRVADVVHRFGITYTERQSELVRDLTLHLKPRHLTAIVGPSGSGKSSILKALQRRIPRSVDVQDMRFDVGRSIVDQVAATSDLCEVIRFLTACGLGEPRLWIRRFDELSEGEQFRARLAKAIESGRANSAPPVILCDEFCSGLHRRMSRAIAYKLRSLTTAREWCLVVALCHDDVLADLQPDVVVRLDGSGYFETQQREWGRRRFSLARRLVIEPGRKADYERFADMHYRATDELGFVQSVFVMRQHGRQEPLGIVVYSHGPLELSLRNYATEGRFKGNPHRLNEELRILRRLVIHPDVRGCGLGRMLVRRTLPRVGTPYVECLAGMGMVNPIFERAGMQRIGQCPRHRLQRRAMEALDRWGVDPFSREFEIAVARQRRVRALVSRVVGRWYEATTSSGDGRVARQSPCFLARTFRGIVSCRPVYYLWERDGCVFPTVPDAADDVQPFQTQFERTLT